MNRRITIFTGALLLVSPFLAAQQSEGPSRLPFPEDVLTFTPPVAWTWMQKPQPTPQPLPPPDKPVPPSDQQPTPSTAPNAHSTAKQVFVGKIVKDGDRLILKTSDGATYQLDEQRNLSQFQDKAVRINGNLDTTSNTIHVVKIELL